MKKVIVLGDLLGVWHHLTHAWLHCLKEVSRSFKVKWFVLQCCTIVTKNFKPCCALRQPVNDLQILMLLPILLVSLNWLSQSFKYLERGEEKFLEIGNCSLTSSDISSRVFLASEKLNTVQKNAFTCISRFLFDFFCIAKLSRKRQHIFGWK